MGKLWCTVLNRKKRVVGLLMLCLLLCACGSAKPESSEEQQNKKALKALEALETQNEKLIQMLKGPSAQEGQTSQSGEQGQRSSKEKSGQEEGSQKTEGQKDGAKKQESQKEDSQKTEGQKDGAKKQESQKEGQEEGAQKKQSQEEGSDKQQGDEKKSGGDQKGGGSQEGQDILMQGDQIDDQDWQKINEGIVELHQRFNEYMPLAMKQGASQDLNSHATDTLNQMTMEAEIKEHLKTLLEANSLSGYISEFYALHKDKRAPIKRSIYFTRSIILASLASDWQTCEAAMNELESIWEIQKPGFSENEKETVEKIDRAVADLKTVIQEENQNLVKIKGNILIINLTELEMAMKTD